jgi:hypothetical protein
MAAIDVVLLTCSQFAGLTHDDKHLYNHLSKTHQGHVRIVSWDDKSFDWSSALLVVSRSPWDYIKRHEEFVAWINEVAKRTILENSPATLLWNSHKSYLCDLLEIGVPTVPSALLKAGRCVSSPPCATFRSPALAAR